jgi:hypothetical protein
MQVYTKKQSNEEHKENLVFLCCLVALCSLPPLGNQNVNLTAKNAKPAKNLLMFSLHLCFFASLRFNSNAQPQRTRSTQRIPFIPLGALGVLGGLIFHLQKTKRGAQSPLRAQIVAAPHVHIDGSTA